jgi:hypothetical protein
LPVGRSTSGRSVGLLSTVQLIHGRQRSRTKRPCTVRIVAVVTMLRPLLSLRVGVAVIAVIPDYWTVSGIVAVVRSRSMSGPGASAGRNTVLARRRWSVVAVRLRRRGTDGEGRYAAAVACGVGRLE